MLEMGWPSPHPLSVCTVPLLPLSVSYSMGKGVEETGTVAQHQHRQKGQRQGGTPPLKSSNSFLYNKNDLPFVSLTLVIFDTLMLYADEAKKVLQMNACRLKPIEALYKNCFCTQLCQKWVPSFLATAGIPTARKWKEILKHIIWVIVNINK